MLQSLSGGAGADAADNPAPRGHLSGPGEHLYRSRGSLESFS